LKEKQLNYSKNSKVVYSYLQFFQHCTKKIILRTMVVLIDFLNLDNLLFIKGIIVGIILAYDCHNHWYIPKNI